MKKKSKSPQKRALQPVTSVLCLDKTKSIDGNDMPTHKTGNCKNSFNPRANKQKPDNWKIRWIYNSEGDYWYGYTWHGKYTTRKATPTGYKKPCFKSEQVGNSETAEYEKEMLRQARSVRNEQLLKRRQRILQREQTAARKINKKLNNFSKKNNYDIEKHRGGISKSLKKNNSNKSAKSPPPPGDTKQFIDFDKLNEKIPNN
jgi:hypothetical protein